MGPSLIIFPGNCMFLRNIFNGRRTMVHVTKNVHCIAYFGKIKQISKKGTRSLQLAILFTAGEHQLKDDWGFFMVCLHTMCVSL